MMAHWKCVCVCVCVLKYLVYAFTQWDTRFIFKQSEVCFNWVFLHLDWLANQR